MFFFFFFLRKLSTCIQFDTGLENMFIDLHIGIDIILRKTIFFNNRAPLECYPELTSQTTTLL